MEIITQAKGSDTILYSIVIPVYNEAEVLPAVYDRLTRVLEGLVEPYEIIFVNDGSHDDSILLLRDFQRGMNGSSSSAYLGTLGIKSPLPRVSIIAQDRQSVVMDADLQDPRKLSHS